MTNRHKRRLALMAKGNKRAQRRYLTLIKKKYDKKKEPQAVAPLVVEGVIFETAEHQG